VSVAIFDDDVWQMSRGERAAVEGVLAQLQPSLALEIGSAEGAGLTRVAAHATEVHSFDLTPPTLPVADNVTLHTGDSHELLPRFLSDLADQGRNVDFVIVDGDHSPEGVRQDVEDLLDSAAVARTVILIHDTANERVRLGVDAVRFRAWPKVTHVELDWIPGRLFAEPKLRNELWYGLGLVLVDSSRLAYTNGSVYEQRYHPSAPLLKEARDRVVARERVPLGAVAEVDQLDALRARVTELTVELARGRGREEAVDGLRERVALADRTLDDVMSSVSWRITEPIRYVKRRARRGVKS
jgi:Methyltransferase domain